MLRQPGDGRGAFGLLEGGAFALYLMPIQPHRDGEDRRMARAGHTQARIERRLHVMELGILDKAALGVLVDGGQAEAW